MGDLEEEMALLLAFFAGFALWVWTIDRWNGRR